MISNYKIRTLINKICLNKDIVQISCQNIENFSRNLYFQVGGLHVRVRILVLVFAFIWSPILKKVTDTDREKRGIERKGNFNIDLRCYNL